MKISKQTATTNSVSERRRTREWSQAELAHRVGISRAAVSAIEGRRLSPSVDTALALASAFDCSVEDLFTRADATSSSTGEWAWQPAREPARYWEATIAGTRRLFPTEATSQNPLPHDGVWERGILRDSRTSAADKTLVLACCDPAAGLLAAEYAKLSGYRMLVFPRGGRTALELLSQNRVHVAGLHYSTEEEPGRNAEMVRTIVGCACKMIRAAKWQSGVALPVSDHSRSIHSMAGRHLRWAMREPGSAARASLDQLLGNRRSQGREVFGHAAVAEAVRHGWAEAGVCVKFSASEYGLNFLPLQTEALDLCFPAGSARDPRIQALVRLLRTREHRRLVSELPGYDARQTGEMLAA